MKKAIGYTRVSTKGQGDSRNGLDAQELDIIRFCEANEIVLLDVRVEVASGGYDLSKRPILASTINDCKVQGAMLLVSKLDRFSRSVEFVSSQMNAMTRARISFVSCEHGLDTDPFLLHLYASLAEKERVLIGQRTKRGLEAAKAKGVKLGIGTHKDGGRAFKAACIDHGIDQSRQANMFAESIRSVVQPMRQAGDTYKAIAERLNSYGTASARGGKWSIVSVRKLLMRLD